MEYKWIWIFNGENMFPSGVFETEEMAFEWISKNKLSGILTCYPLNIGVYDWAIKEEYFTPKKEHQKTPEFISKFSAAALRHYHIEDGVAR